MIAEKIVIIDDDKRIHEALKLILFEHQLIFFTDGQEALEFLMQPHDVKLVLLDICMKGLNGLEVLNQIKKLKNHLAVMMITGHGNQDMIVEALRGHADDFIEKPFDVHELKERVKILLKQQAVFDPMAHDHEDHVEKIKDFIVRNSHNVTLKDVAREFSLSPAYMSRLFGANDDMGFRAFKLKVRMEKAKDMLIKTSLDISQIGLQLGYENPESFMRAFRAYTQVPPGEFRRQHLNRRRG